MSVQVRGSKLAKARVEISPSTVADKGRAPSRKTRRRGNKTSLTVVVAATASTTPSVLPMQKLFDTSKEVFAHSSPGFVPPPDAVVRLSGILNGLKPDDVGIDSNVKYFKHVGPRCPPPVTYLHFYDCPKFSFGIFCLPKSAVIPLHNHPGMTVFSKILFGSMHLKSYDWAKSSPDSNDTALESSDGARLAKVNTDAVFDASSKTVVLYPENGGNLHCFTALTPCAVLDVLGPPYNPDDGRDCTYYNESVYASSSGGDEKYSWLKEIRTTFKMKGIKMPREFII
ncbi:hypothetical protein HU200_019375 [Digitaria exilis]|uniref:cysteine dioxygenase n=1 Tax=Digitaria exilis TaxID=1010633 RepID=A0A835F353_9POAL|nr:hypothetical protein HU200_019375 [Digitaria exilis]CAB3464269.1 unnamed protein product [Digitaria exilis]